MKINSTQITHEALEAKTSILLHDIRANLEGIAALATALHMVADPELEEPLMDAQTISCAIYGLEMAVKNLDAAIGEQQDEICKEKLYLSAEGR